ncbi:MAG: Gfo/Idh/MocA family oxidoreductase [Gemmatimonadetes bacterium]|nr:Gfo/Idh/MocA family oxidoreductase [Gemmatimonadota bacterium]
MKAIIIGYGYMGQIRRKVVESLGDIDLVAVCDQLQGPQDIGGEYLHFHDYETAIEEIRPDLVFVCTPNCYSPDICVYALEHGCHVFCEKPPGRNLADIQRIRDCELSHSGQKVMFGFNHRHHPAILEAKSIVDAGRMGRVLWLRGVYGKSGGRDFESSWRNDPQVSGGGILLDQGIHMLDLFRFFCGDFQQIHGLLSSTFWDVPVEDNAFVAMRNDRGQSAQLHSSATLWKHTFRLDIGLEGGYLIAEGLLSQSGSYGRETLTIGRKSKRGDAVGNPREEVVYFDRDLSWELQVRELVNCIREDSPVTDSSTLDALKVMEIIDTVYRQEKTNEAGRPQQFMGGIS